MRTWALGMTGLMVLCVVAGCRRRTEITEVPRVDLELEGGNRGYVVGAPPVASRIKTTRQIIETTIELPGASSASAPTPADLAQVPIVGESTDAAWLDTATGPMADSGEASASAAAEGSMDAYVVQKGDSLWSIAARAEIYGKATRWRQIFDANRDVLKTPDDLRVGMTLKIPRTTSAGSTTYDDEGITVKK